MTKKHQEILLLHLHTLNQVPTLPPRKRSSIKALAEVRKLLPDESNHLLEKDKIKDFKGFSNYKL